jgi:lipopolysaccharide transport system ATP-binding protein
MAAVENLCTRGIWIDAGSVRQDGPVFDVIKSYMTANSTESGSANLRDFPNRRGGGEVRYTAARFLDLNRRPLDVIRAGDPVIIRFDYDVEKPLPNLSFGFRINTEMGTLVTETNTRVHDIDLPTMKQGGGYLELEINALNLLPGRYFLTLGIATIGGAVHDVLDNCISFDIEPGQIFGTGRITDNRYGVVFFPQRWHLDGIRKIDQP